MGLETGGEALKWDAGVGVGEIARSMEVIAFSIKF